VPVIAIAGAVAGASALATVGVAGLGVWGTIGAIGGIVSGIGAVTKSKELMALGAVAGLAGGVGAFASSQGWLGATSAAESATSAAGEAGMTAGAMNSPGVGVENVTPTIDAGMGAQEPVSSLFDTAAESTAGLTQTTSELATQANPLASEAAKSATSLSKAALDGTNAFGANSMPGAFDLAGAPGKSILDRLSDFGKFMKDNKELSMLAGNMIGGIFDEKKEAEAEFLRARIDSEKQQAANANAVPNLGVKLKKKDNIFRQSGPAYAPIRTSGLFYA
jgi:hypothetical protein